MYGPTARGTIHVETAEVLAIEAHAGAQHLLRLRAPETARRALAGQFVHLVCGPGLPMRRPMSIMRSGGAAGWIDILFKVHGEGTALLAGRRPGDTLSLMGPIGQPFRQAGHRRRPLLIGGGVGIPPMVFLAEHLRQSAPEVRPLVLMGSEVPFPFRPVPSRILVPGVPEGCIAAMPLLEDWGIASRLASGSSLPGCHEGYVTSLAEAVLASAADLSQYEIYACGPTPMLAEVRRVALAFDLPCQISLEEYMACAVGGCAGCTVLIDTPDGPAMKRVCVDGPVFEARTVRFGG